MGVLINWINVLVVCLVFVACRGSPVVLQQEKEILRGFEDATPAGNVLCMTTPFGCTDSSDPQFGPRDHEEVTNVENSFADENDGLDSIYGPPCIPTAWGCIDPSDPGIRPK